MDARSHFVWLDQSQTRPHFPDPQLAMREPNGLLAAGGNLSPAWLLAAYEQGIFPWFSPGEPILWWSPDPRAVLPCGQLHRSQKLQRKLRQERFAATWNLAFTEVLRHCSRANDPDQGIWLGPQMQQAYTELHRLGHAHSVEIWIDQTLAGAVYGVRRGPVFFAESMVSLRSDGSKLALCALEDVLLSLGVNLIDAQIPSAHLARMGFESWARGRFLSALRSRLTTARVREPAAGIRRRWLAGNVDHLPNDHGLQTTRGRQ
nr:leucyl/phenylalanyl-tRNA--protein transferase [Oceanococcus sp. HetDA_MAG_MS8]